jgi:hypothetical protein
MVRIVIVLVVYSLIASGCTKYQYATLGTDLPKTRKGEIIVDTDTVLIRYRFSGLECPATFQLYNKLSRPLHINWDSSHIVVRTRDWPRGKFAGAESQTLKWSERRYPLVEGPEKQLNHLTEIPPHTFLDGAINSITQDFFKLSYPQLKTTEVAGQSLQVQNFREPQSPLQFQSTLMLFVDNKPMRIVNRFWVEEISQGFLKPEMFESYRGRDDKYYVTRTVGVKTIVVLAVAASYVVGWVLVP